MRCFDRLESRYANGAYGSSAGLKIASPFLEAKTAKQVRPRKDDNQRMIFQCAETEAIGLR